MLVEILLLIVGLVILTYGADKFVEGASSLAKKFNISELAIGLTVVAFGTSAPELIVNVFAAWNGNNGIAYGNIIGSNSFNLLFILGIAAMIYPLTAHPNIVKKDTGYSLLAALLVFVLVNDQMLWGIAPETAGLNNYPVSAPIINAQGAEIGKTYFGGIMSYLDAGILLLFFAYFLYYVFKNTSADVDKASEDGEIQELSPSLTAIYTLGGLTSLVIGGYLIVENAVSMAKTFGMSEAMIGLTIVSAGTSLPELATSCIAAYKKKSDIAIANVIGSNIFNIFFVLSASAMISPIPYNASVLNIDIYVLVISTVVFFAFLFMSKPVPIEGSENGKPLMGRVFQRWQGLVFLLAYIAYTVYLVMRG
jgi:cation:H+ antiporter